MWLSYGKKLELSVICDTLTSILGLISSRPGRRRDIKWEEICEMFRRELERVYM